MEVCVRSFLVIVLTAIMLPVIMEPSAINNEHQVIHQTTAQAHSQPLFPPNRHLLLIPLPPFVFNWSRPPPSPALDSPSLSSRPKTTEIWSVHWEFILTLWFTVFEQCYASSKLKKQTRCEYQPRWNYYNRVPSQHVFHCLVCSLYANFRVSDVTFVIRTQQT